MRVQNNVIYLIRLHITGVLQFISTVYFIFPSQSTMNFTNKIVILTGATAGIGETTVLLLAKYGAEFILVGRNPDTMHRFTEECQKIKAKPPLILTADVTKEKDIKLIEKEVIERYGRVDILLNIAGGIETESILAPNLDAFDYNLNVNLRSVYMMIATFAPHLIRSKGNVVNVGSVFGDIIFPGQTSYNISKVGLEYLTKVAALELAAKGVRVNCVKPGYTRTDVTLKMYGGDRSYPSYEYFTKLIPMGRIITPEDIAQAIAFLASELAKNITGASIVIDGGQSLWGTSLFEKIRTAFE